MDVLSGSDQLVSWCMWGLSNILKALKFLNEDAKQVHGMIHPCSIFVTQVSESEEDEE